MKKRNNLIRYALLLVACIVIGLYALALAKTVLWKWVDEKGIAHYVDELYKVPEKYRAKAVKVEIEGAETHPIPDSPPPPPQTKQEDPDAAKKAEWIAKAQQAVQAVKSLQEEIKKTEPECDALLRQWQTNPNIAGQEALAQCNQKVEQLKADLAKAIEYRDRGIYKEAMDAGIPIAWFEEILKQK